MRLTFQLKTMEKFNMNSEIKVVVLCVNSEGQPEFYPCLLEVTSEEVSEGKHLELAKEDAALNGYGGPMIAFDNTSPAGVQLGEILAWL